MSRRTACHAARAKVPFPVLLAGLIAAAIAIPVWRATRGSGGAEAAPNSHGASGTTATPTPTATPTTTPTITPTPSPMTSPTPGPINTSFPGLTTFRGNATRDYYGEGPVPTHPKILWRYPRTGALCSSSSNLGVTKLWCGTGWTGQPNVIQHPNGTIEVREGAYDSHYHFLNGKTGLPMRPDLVTGDLAKGSATSDSNGYPLYYGGSRDNLLRVVALDRPRPTVLWSFNSRSQPGMLWNDDWDGAPLQVGDYLLEGGENSWFYVIRLHRRYDAKGLVQVSPEIVVRVPGWDQQLLNSIGDHDVSIEDSVAFSDGVVYFSNGGGLVQGWDISDILRGRSHYRRVFRFWDGDDTDASIVIDPSGDLIVGRKMEENVPRPQSFPRDHQIGDLMKLDPSKPNDPLVWSVQLGGFEPDGGILGTPAYYQGIVYATYTEGGIAAIDERTGKLLWNRSLAGPTWSSPVPIGGKLIVGDGAGYLNCFDIARPRSMPKLLWRLHLGGIIESTPAVWRGWIYVGTRDGGIYGVANAATP
jgi:outer membrane protein assembly factor BamB